MKYTVHLKSPFPYFYTLFYSFLLPLTKTIIKAHNGTIKRNSLSGVGTTFTINFLIPTKL
ncbi:hypothetical protein HMPREF1548_01391 [Clostridium sp. KLE 1755]|nr:hypothetical protein HMPREF1548_01391 [Clostridium sp. KLE 1755]